MYILDTKLLIDIQFLESIIDDYEATICHYKY